MFGPAIEGQKCVLRPPTVEEAQIYADWFLDAQVTRWLMNQFVPAIEAERDWITRRAEDFNCIAWAIEVDGRVVGLSDANVNWKNQVGVTGTIIGDKSVWGQGIGGESMLLRRDYLFRNHPLRKLRSGYLDPNQASARAQAAAGYRIVGTYVGEFYCEGQWADHVLTEILREEWEQL